MSPCVWIDLGDGDFIKPNFAKAPTPEQIEAARKWGLAQKALLQGGGCRHCNGKGKRTVRDLETSQLVERTCDKCEGTGRKPVNKESNREAK